MNQQVIMNAAWMMSEKFFSLFGVVFVTSYVAKSFGPLIFGQINLALAVFSLIQAVAILGTETTLLKSISKKPRQGFLLLVVASGLRVKLLLALSVPVFVFSLYAMPRELMVFMLAAFLASLFICLDTASVYHHARLQSRLNTLANACGLVASFALSYAIARLRLDPLLLSLPLVVQTLIPWAIRRRGVRHLSAARPLPRQHRRYRGWLLRAGTPLALTSVLVTLQVKMVPLFLAHSVSAQALGLFTAASQLAASWIFIPLALITSSFPAIFRQPSGQAFVLAARLCGTVLLVSLLMCLLVALCGQWLLSRLYGPAYAPAAGWLTLLSLAGACSALGTVAWRYMVKEGGYHYLLVKILLLALAAFVVCRGCIQAWGINGAAWSVLLTELFSLTVMNYLFRRGLILKMHLAAFHLKTWR